MNNGIRFFTTYQGKRVFAGCVIGKKFFKSVTSSDRLKKHDSFGLDVSYMPDVFRCGTNFIVITVNDTGEKFSITVRDFKAHAIMDVVGKKFGPRFYCPLRFWRKAKAKVAEK